MPLLQSALDKISPNVVADIAITALLIYWLFSLIRGTRAVRLVVGVCLLFLVYGAALAFDLRLLILILQTGAYVGLFALVVVFQPELRRALDRIGRLGSLGWLISPAEQSRATHIAAEVASAAARLSHEGQGALIVIERESGLQEIAETGVMLHADISADLLVTVFSPKTPLHDGAVVIRGDTVLAAGALLPSAETTIPLERFGTRHKAALGMTEQTDALVVVVSEESGQISLVERARIVRNLDEAKLARALMAHLHPQVGGGRLLRETGRSTRVAPSFRALARKARLGGRRRVSEAPRKDRSDRRPPRIEPPRADQPRADDESGQARAAP
ncbi:MAG: diadenylate cyclase CdaA [Candidatus Limnocylindrales bacterium]|jgi:diadenylate cyclase